MKNIATTISTISPIIQKNVLDPLNQSLIADAAPVIEEIPELYFVTVNAALPLVIEFNVTVISLTLSVFKSKFLVSPIFKETVTGLELIVKVALVSLKAGFYPDPVVVHKHRASSAS